MKRIIVLAVASVALFGLAAQSSATVIWASELGPFGLSRGDTSIGDFTGFYGGTWPAPFPVELTAAAAEAAVLGAPDLDFLTLPGNEAADPTPPGDGFRWAYADVAFPALFTAADDLVIVEQGGDSSMAQLFIWTTDGSNVQPIITRGASEQIIVDLSPYAAFVAAHGSFSHVIIGGQDLNGGSKGFDLDAVGVQPVPEPGTVALLLAGLAAFGLRGGRSRKQ